MSLPVFTTMIWSIIALAWVGFLIIFVALVRDAMSVVAGRKDDQEPNDSESEGES